MFKAQVEPQAAGEWFHCQFLSILRRHFMVYNSIDHRKLTVPTLVLAFMLISNGIESSMR